MIRLYLTGFFVLYMLVVPMESAGQAPVQQTLIYDALGRTRPTFDSIVARVTVIGKRQMDQVRNAFRVVETVPTQ